jgi:hypothetical protein
VSGTRKCTSCGAVVEHLSRKTKMAHCPTGQVGYHFIVLFGTEFFYTRPDFLFESRNLLTAVPRTAMLTRKIIRISR